MNRPRFPLLARMAVIAIALTLHKPRMNNRVCTRSERMRRGTSGKKLQYADLSRFGHAVN
jgi:hypothetical protein